MSLTTTSHSSRIARVDAMRALAVVLVVAWHAGFYKVPGLHGVTIFFVISGFVITRLMIREREVSGTFDIRAFYLRRFWKIMPPLAGCILIPSIILFAKLQLSVGAVVSQTLFTFNYWRLLAVSYEDSVAHNFPFLPGSQVVWSLSVEEQFYIAGAVIWLFLARRKNSAKLLLATFICLYVASVTWRFYFEMVASRNDPWSGRVWVGFATDCRVSSIALGGIVAILVEKSEDLHTNIRGIVEHLTRSRILLPAGFAFWIVASIVFEPKELSSHTYAAPVVSRMITLVEIGAALVVWSAANTNGWPKILDKVASLKPVQIMGLASYSIYLIHLALYTETIEIAKSHLPTDLVMPAEIILCISAGLAVHFVLDKPFEKQRAKWRPVSR